jgi:hypothetical protein
MAVIFVIAPYSLVEICRVSEVCCLVTLMMEAASTSERSMDFDQTTRRNNPDDSRLHPRRRENLKLYLFNSLNEYASHTFL